MELVDFLRARLAEDEQHQKDRLEGWHARDCESLPDGDRVTYACDCGVPARVLAEVEAKRLIVERAEQYQRWAMNEGTAAFRALDEAGKLMLRYLALPHADHADYDASWKP